MSSISEEIIKNLNRRLLTQSVIIESICELLITNGIVSEEDLGEKIQKNLDIHEEFINKQLSNSKKSTALNLMGFFGPIGEC